MSGAEVAAVDVERMKNGGVWGRDEGEGGWLTPAQPGTQTPLYAQIGFVRPQ